MLVVKYVEGIAEISASTKLAKKYYLQYTGTWPFISKYSNYLIFYTNSFLLDTKYPSTDNTVRFLDKEIPSYAKDMQLQNLSIVMHQLPAW